MAATTSPITYTETEIRSFLPSGWSISPGSSGTWSAGEGSWSIDVVDGADQRWTVTVEASDVEKSGRLGALDAFVRRLERRALGRKSVISG
jgi:hypothetical protein